MSIYCQIHGNDELEKERKNLYVLYQKISDDLNSFRRNMVATTHYTFGGETCVDYAPEMIEKRNEYNLRMSDFRTRENDFKERVRDWSYSLPWSDEDDGSEAAESAAFRNHAERRFR